MMPVLRHQDNVPVCSSSLPMESQGNMAVEREGFPLPSLSLKNAAEKTRTPRLLIIREELVDLTGDSLTAALLCQMLYWSQKVSDFDLYLEEEKEGSHPSSSSLQYGWFYKSKRELMEETMLRVTLATFRRYLNFLRYRGWIQTRRDPHNKLSSKVQYRLSLRKISTDLQRKGYTIPSWEVYGILPSVSSLPSSEPKRVEVSSEPHEHTSSKGRCA